MAVTIEPVTTRSGLRAFVKLPYRLYRGDANWVPPLLVDDYRKLDRARHPFFKHAAAEILLARRDGRPAGRIVAIHDELWEKTYGERAAYWGWFECENDVEVARALFDAARRWAKDRGCTRIFGPMSPNANDLVGLLVKGFDGPPVIMMSYNPPYYADLVEAAGGRTWKDLIAWLLDSPEIPERLEHIMPMVEKRGRFTLRKINMKDFPAEVERARAVYNEFEKVNAIYTPFTREEFEYLGKDLKMGIDPDIVFFAEVDGKTVGVSLGLPDHNVGFRAARGHLFPFGIFKIMLARQADPPHPRAQHGRAEGVPQPGHRSRLLLLQLQVRGAQGVLRRRDVVGRGGQRGHDQHRDQARRETLPHLPGLRAGAVGTSGGGVTVERTLVLVNATVRTMDARRTVATAVAARAGRVVFVGDDQGARAAAAAGPGNARAEVIDLHGACVLPGLVDAHLHFAWFARSLEEVDGGAPTRGEAVERVRARAASTTAGEWIGGSCWDHNIWDRLPSRQDLDAAAPRNPAALKAKSGHALWVNSLALKAAGIGKGTPDPAGGAIARDAGGEPTGILYENAMDLVQAVIPERSAEAIAASMRAAQERVLAAGLTGFHDFDGVPAFRALQLMLGRGVLDVRVVKGIPRETLGDAVALGLRSGFGDDLLAIGPVKLFADGALGPQTAWMLEPYEGSTGTGIPTLTPEELRADIGRARAAGLACAVHAIGDAAVRAVLDAFEATRGSAAAGAGPPPRSLPPAGPHRARAAHLARRPAEAVRARDRGVHAADPRDVRPGHRRPALGRAHRDRLRVAQRPRCRRGSRLRLRLPRGDHQSARGHPRRGHPAPRRRLARPRRLEARTAADRGGGGARLHPRRRARGGAGTGCGHDRAGQARGLHGARGRSVRG